MIGDVWSVAPMPRTHWQDEPDAIWEAVQAELRAGWGGKLKDAHRLARRRRFDDIVAQIAAELGAPVGQLFTVCQLRTRRAPEHTEDGR